MERNLYNYIRKAVSICKDFDYPKEVIEEVKNAKTENEVSTIMEHARQKYL